VAWRRGVFALFAVAAGTNVPTPLLLLYQQRFGLSTEVITVLFATYAAGLVPALFVAGPLSDRLGRRRVALPGVALAGLASVAFAGAGHSLVLLFAARFLQGVVSGAVFSVGSAWVAELSAASGLAAGGRRAAIAMTAGFSLGPLVSGLLGQFAPAPTVLPYLLHAALSAVALALALPLPETVGVRRHDAGGAVHVQPVHLERVPVVAPGRWPQFLTVLAPVAVCVYAFPSSVVSAVPLLGTLPATGVAVVGVLAGITLGAGALVAGLQARLGPWTAVVGSGLGALGFAAAALFVGRGGLAWLFLAAVLLGSGSGLCLAAGLALVARMAPPQHRGALTSWFLACAYLGFATPFLLATAARSMSGAVPLTVAAVVVAVVAVRLVPAARQRQL
jgi:MFS family permease